MTELQLFAALDPATEAALRSSIARFGVLVPVVKDQRGRILDGHHRSRIADDLDVLYRVDVVKVSDDAEAEAIARTLNTDRRHLSLEQRVPVVVAMHEAGHSNVAIAKAHGVDEKTVRRDLTRATSAGAEVHSPDRTVGLDGKSRPTRRPPVVPTLNPNQEKRARKALSAEGLTVEGAVPVDVVETDARRTLAAESRGFSREQWDASGDRIQEIRDDLAESTGIPWTLALRKTIAALAAYSRGDAPEKIARYFPNEPQRDRESIGHMIEQAETALRHVKEALNERRMEAVK